MTGAFKILALTLLAGLCGVTVAAEIAMFLRAGIDGLFTDDPASGRAAIKEFQAK